MTNVVMANVTWIWVRTATLAHLIVVLVFSAPLNHVEMVSVMPKKLVAIALKIVAVALMVFALLAKLLTTVDLTALRQSEVKLLTTLMVLPSLVQT